jgi:hypothetical protein
VFVHLASKLFDLSGAVLLDCMDDTNAGQVQRRVNRVATLDGAAAFNDFGFAEADRTIELRWMPTTAAAEAVVGRLVRVHRMVYVSMPDGLWLAAPEVYTPGADESRLTLLVSERCTAQE